MASLFAMTLPALVLGLVALGLWELLRSRTTRRPRTGTAMAGFQVLEGILTPSKVHEMEERRRVELMRDDVDDGAPPFSQIDLEAGKARLVVPSRSDEAPAR